MSIQNLNRNTKSLVMMMNLRYKEESEKKLEVAVNLEETATERFGYNC